METEKPSEPDSTTLEKDVRHQFRKSEDVLCLNSKDGCFYLGTIVQIYFIWRPDTMDWPKISVCKAQIYFDCGLVEPHCVETLIDRNCWVKRATADDRELKEQWYFSDVGCREKRRSLSAEDIVDIVDNIYKKCLVEFLDNTKMWSSFKDLKNFKPQEPEICYVCKKSQLKDENNIIICKCGRECQQDNLEVNSSTEYYGRGLVKRSTPFPVSDQANNVDSRFRSHAVRKARRLLNKNFKRKKTAETSVLQSKSHVVESQEKKNYRVSHKNFPQTFEEFVQFRKRKMDLRTSQRSPEIRKRPQRNLLEARLNSTESKLYNPFTPVDTSDSRKNKNVSHESNKKSESSSKKSSKSHKAKSYEKRKTKSKLVQKTIFDSFSLKTTDKHKYENVPLVKVKESDQTSVDSKATSIQSGRGRRFARSESLDRTPAESDIIDSSDDEASSRGTLEPFIPTPKDFEGQNHPFRSVTDLINFPSATVTHAPPITLPLPLKTVIPHSDPPRLKKRQLSEDDIIIDRNGQVKRRRRHRKSIMAPGTAAKSAQITPGKNNKKHWGMRSEKKMLQPLVNNGGDFALNGRQLRAREPIKISEKPIPSAKPSPIKQSPTKDGNPLGEDLESSVKYFFGAASRIMNGEKYEVRAKRITFDGRLQCIIDWKGPPT